MCLFQGLYDHNKHILIPVADSLQMGMDRSSELTALDSGSMVRTTNGNCLLVSSLLPSVEIVNGPERMRSAKFFCVKRARSCRIAVVLFLPHLISITQVMQKCMI